MMKHACLLALALSTAAAAQTTGRTFPAERLEPAIDTEGIGNTQWAGVPDSWGWDAALWLDYEQSPLFRYTGPASQNPLERRDTFVRNRFAGDAVVALALFQWIQLGIDVPVLLYQERDDAQAPALDRTRPLSTFGLGDVSVTPKLRILRQQDGAKLDLAALLPFTAPTAGPAGADFFGDSGFTITPGLAASREWGPVRAALNVGHRFRTPRDVLGLTIGNELIAKAGLAYRFDVVPEHSTELGLSLSAAAATDALFRGENSPARNPVELLVDVQHQVSGPVDVFFGGGAGLVAGFGVPDYRLYAGVRYADRPPADYDGDGLVGAADKCPKEPENINGFEDADGCPDAGDDDHDGIRNDKDKCPTQPEDIDGFEDDDGCPDPDNDKDGVLDVNDKCPLVPEDKDGFEDDDGCPDPDNDKDTFLDVDDACPNEAGIKQNHGCPDHDKDGDTVVDRLDNCPDEPGPPENGGCAKKQLVVITDAKLEIKDRVYFDTDKDTIQPKSFALLDNVAAVLKAHPDIKKVRVEGHTDTVGTPAHNMDLSDRRAKSVRKYLVDKGGVDLARLDAVGYGQDRPIATNDTDDGKQQNRRVEFMIVDAESAPAPTPPASPAP